MKIYILPVPQVLQPATQPFPYPPHNADYGVEQDFLIWLEKQPHLLTQNPESADWHYLPVFWTRWYLNHNFAIDESVKEELQSGVTQSLLRNDRVFTICQYDGGPAINAGNMVSFLAARTAPGQGIDIPILCTPHRVSPFPPAKKYKASFNGEFATYPVRKEMADRLQSRPDVHIHGYLPTRFYLRWLGFKSYNRRIRESYIALAPRGTSMNSFRLFEAMQMGVAPCLIGDEDARPFRKFIDWDKVSYYAPDVDTLEKIIDTLNPEEALQKGKAARKLFYSDLFYQKWCKYVIMELQDRFPLQPESR